MRGVATDTARSHDKPPLREVPLWTPELRVDQAADGSVYVRQAGTLGPYPDRLTDRLAHWADAAPERTFLAERAPDGGWRRVSYGEAFAAVRRLGAALLGFGLSAERPLAILSGNDIEHALLGLAAYYVGVPYAPISPAYATVAEDFTKLRGVMRLLTPGLVFAADGERFAPAIEAAATADAPVIVTRNPIAGRTRATVDELAATEPGPAADAAHAAVGPETIAKFMFTSGSTGAPKAVVNTQRMLCTNQAMVLDCFAWMRDEPPVVLDWAPWNHTAGGNKVYGMVLYNGGTFYIDDGNPSPAGIRATARNLRDVEPTWYFNVPKGLEELVPLLEADRALRRALFGRLRMIFYAGAGIAQHTWDALDRLSADATGERVLRATGLGATETGPFALACTEEQEIAGNVGIPARAVELKLVPAGDKLEARLRGPNITPGYWRDAELTRKAFDAEGFYRLGDALRYAEPGDARKGFFFDGRLAENFKLSTGTWVGVGALRARLVNHFGTLARDAVIAGHDRPFVAALIVPNLPACRALCGDPPAATPDAEILRDPRVVARFRALLSSFAEAATGSSTLVRRIILLEEPLSLDRGELTDKGSINQRAVLREKAALVEALYADGSPRVISIDDPD